MEWTLPIRMAILIVRQHAIEILLPGCVLWFFIYKHMEVTYKSKFEIGDVVYAIVPEEKYNKITHRNKLKIQKVKIKLVSIHIDGKVLYKFHNVNVYSTYEEYISKTNTKEFKDKLKEANRNSLKESKNIQLKAKKIRKQ